jgi:hypothetical protein
LKRRAFLFQRAPIALNLHARAFIRRKIPFERRRVAFARHRSELAGHAIALLRHPFAISRQLFAFELLGLATVWRDLQFRREQLSCCVL